MIPFNITDPKLSREEFDAKIARVRAGLKLGRIISCACLCFVVLVFVLSLLGCGKRVNKCPVCEKPMEIYENAPVCELFIERLFLKADIRVLHVWACPGTHAIWATRDFMRQAWKMGECGRADAYISKESR